jgi:hypothetical protein
MSAVSQKKVLNYNNNAVSRGQQYFYDCGQPEKVLNSDNNAVSRGQEYRISRSAVIQSKY